MSLEVAALREQFPSLQSGIAHFDGPGGTQTPRQVGAAMAATLTGPLSNRGTSVASERSADDAVGAFRTAVADLLAADPGGIVFGRSATQLTYDVSRTLARTWGPGDEVVVSALDHDANVRPWIQAAESAGATVRWIEFEPATAEMTVDHAAAVIGERTKLVAVTGASNLIGTRPPVRAIADLVHAHRGLLWVDGVHLTPHATVDVDALGADFYVCSSYKFLGPHCAALAAAPILLETLHPDKLLPSTDRVPERFEFGTLPYEMLAGVTAAIDFLAGIAGASGPADPAVGRRAALTSSMDAVHAHESALLDRLAAGLAGFGDAVVSHSRAADRTPTVLLSLPGRRTKDASAFLAERDVLAPAGSFYAVEPFRRLGIDDDGGLRIGLAPYSSEDDIDRLLTGLGDFLR